MKKLLTIITFSSTILALSAANSGETAPKLSKLLPGAKLPDTAGKVILVDFWASWCGHCKASFPTLNKLNATYSGKGLVIIGIGVDDKPEAYQAFSNKMKATFPLVHDATHQAVAAFKPSSMPSSYIIDRKGVIRHAHTGFNGAKTEQEYTKEIEALLAEK